MARVAGPDPTDPDWTDRPRRGSATDDDVAEADAELRHGLAFATLVAAARPWADLLGGLAQAARRHGVAVTISFTPFDPPPEAE